MQKVLIPIGYHPVSEQIAKTGYELAKKLKAKTCLMHVVGDISYYKTSYPEFFGFSDFGTDFHIQEFALAEEAAKNFLKKVADQLDGEVETYVGRGETAFSILEYAKEWDADIIVLGTHSRGILKKVFMGSKAVRVLENTKIPVYMVPVKK